MFYCGCAACPMCEKEIDAAKVVKVADPTPYLKKGDGEAEDAAAAGKA